MLHHVLLNPLHIVGYLREHGGVMHPTPEKSAIKMKPFALSAKHIEICCTLSLTGKGMILTMCRVEPIPPQKKLKISL